MPRILVVSFSRTRCRIIHKPFYLNVSCHSQQSVSVVQSSQQRINAYHRVLQHLLKASIFILLCWSRLCFCYCRSCGLDVPLTAPAISSNNSKLLERMPYAVPPKAGHAIKTTRSIAISLLRDSCRTATMAPAVWSHVTSLITSPPLCLLPQPATINPGRLWRHFSN